MFSSAVDMPPQDLALPALEWHREVRLFIRESTSSAQVAWAGLCHDGDGRPSDTGFVIVRDESVAEPVARALRKASKGRLKVGRFAEWRQAAPSGVF